MRKGAKEEPDFLVIDKPMDVTKFKVGDTVWVAYNIRSQKGWRRGWNEEMGRALSKKFVVLEVNKMDGYQLKTKVDGMGFDYWFPDAALVADKVFAQGDKVYIACDPKGWLGRVAPMESLVGSRATVMSVSKDYVTLDNSYSYPAYALVSDDPKEKLDMKTTVMSAHDPTKFPPGSKVLIVREVLTQPGWKNQWNASKDEGMSRLVGDGKVYTVRESDMYGVRLVDTNFSWPSGCFELENKSGLPDVVAKPVKKRRVRVGPGPWDKAPCTHLRWHLMGFFREKLAFKKTKTVAKVPLPDGTYVESEVELASVQVVCTKCGTSMTLNAK